jgi:hypothetical protein
MMVVAAVAQPIDICFVLFPESGSSDRIIDFQKLFHRYHDAIMNWAQNASGCSIRQAYIVQKPSSSHVSIFGFDNYGSRHRISLCAGEYDHRSPASLVIARDMVAKNRESGNIQIIVLFGYLEGKGKLWPRMLSLLLNETSAKAQTNEIPVIAINLAPSIYGFGQFSEDGSGITIVTITGDSEIEKVLRALNQAIGGHAMHQQVPGAVYGGDGSGDVNCDQHGWIR